jgi:HlyD family secretion protein
MNTVLNYIKNKKTRNWGIAAITVLVIGGLVWYYSSANASTATVVNTEATVVLLNVAETITASGSLAAQPFANLEWKASGVVEDVNAQAGDLVKIGKILLALQPSSTSANIVSAKADLIQSQKDLEILMKSDTERAQAAIDLQDATDVYKTAKNWRISLNGKIWTKYITYKTIGGQQIPVLHSYRAYADPATIAKADRDLALKMSALEDAQRTYDRLKDGPNTDDVAAAQAKVDASQATVNSLSIIAPFDGQVLSVENRTGDTVTAGDLSVNLADMAHLYVETQVDESDIASVKLGNQAEVTLDAVSGVTLTGEVSAINPVGEVVSGLVKYKVRIDLDKVKDGTFLPLGTTANVVIQTKAASAALALAIAAIQNDVKGEYVWVIQSDGSTKRVDVVSGVIVGDQVVVVGDLKEGDRVQLVTASSFQTTSPLSGGN